MNIREKQRIKSTAVDLVMVYLENDNTTENMALNPALEQIHYSSGLSFNTQVMCFVLIRTEIYKLMVMKSKLQFESPISRALAMAVKDRERRK